MSEIVNNEIQSNDPQENAALEPENVILQNHDVAGNNDNTAETNDSPVKKKLLNKKSLIAVVAITIVAIIAISLFSGGGLSNSKLQRIIENAGVESFDISNLKTVDSLKLNDGSGDVMILFEGSFSDYEGTGFMVVTVNPETEKVTGSPILTDYYPLRAFFEHCIGGEPRSINKSLFSKMSDYVQEYGIDFTKDIEISKEFLGEVTGKGGIISTTKARKYISQGVETNLLAEIDHTYFELVFEEDSAIPRFIFFETTENEFNSSYGVTEDQYSYLDSQTKSIFRSMYGEPYKKVQVWYAHDPETFEEVKKFESKWFTRESALEILYNEA